MHKCTIYHRFATRTILKIKLNIASNCDSRETVFGLTAFGVRTCVAKGCTFKVWNTLSDLKSFLQSWGTHIKNIMKYCAIDGFPQLVWWFVWVLQMNFLLSLVVKKGVKAFDGCLENILNIQLNGIILKLFFFKRLYEIKINTWNVMITLTFNFNSVCYLENMNKN